MLTSRCHDAFYDVGVTQRNAAVGGRLMKFPLYVCSKCAMTSTCSACSGIYTVMVLFSKSPEISSIRYTHNTQTCAGRQFPALADRNARDQINKATREATPSILYQMIVDWTNNKPCIIALKLPTSSESPITIARKNDYMTNPLTMPKSALLCTGIPPSNSELGLLFATAIKRVKIGLSDNDVRAIVALHSLKTTPSGY